MLSRVDEALDRWRNERAHEVGIALEQVLMHDDAVADHGDTGIGEPENAHLLFAADFDARHIAEYVTTNGIDLTAE